MAKKRDPRIVERFPNNEGLTGVPSPDWSEQLTMTVGVSRRNHLYGRRFLTNFERCFDIWISKLAYIYAGIYGYLLLF